MTEHILDRPIWNALNTKHSGYALGGGNARRFEPDICPLGGVGDESEQSLQELSELVLKYGRLVIAQAAELKLPDGLKIVSQTTCEQMVLDNPNLDHEHDYKIERLNADDADEMLALANLTMAGLFDKRTQVLGEYWGVRQDGELVAMAGERLKNPGLTEISGVCTHPNFQRRGLNKCICADLAKRIIARGEQPYLHYYSSNEAAKALYQKLGFKVRQTLNVMEMASIK